MLYKIRNLFEILTLGFQISLFVAEEMLENLFFRNNIIPKVLSDILLPITLCTVGLSMLSAVAQIAYHKLMGDAEKAAEIQSAHKALLDKILVQAKRFCKRALIGAIVATLSLTTFVSMSIITEMMFPSMFKDCNDDFEDIRAVVLYAPILEELLFRGVVLNAFKVIYNNITSSISGLVTAVTHNFEPKKNIYLSPIINAVSNISDKVASVGTKIHSLFKKITAPLSEPETNANTPPKNYTAILGSALLFSAAHCSERQPYAFFGGVVSGMLYEEYQGDLVPCIAEHMTNNAIATVGSEVIGMRIRSAMRMC